MTIDIVVGEVNESCTSYLTINFWNADGVLTAPTSATYQIHDIWSGTVTRDVTALPAGAMVTVTISPTENAILNQLHAFENREVTVTASFGAGDQMLATTQYRINNLRFKTP